MAISELHKITEEWLQDNGVEGHITQLYIPNAGPALVEVELHDQSTKCYLIDTHLKPAGFTFKQYVERCNDGNEST